MRWVLLGAIALGLLTLTLARYISDDVWVHFLMATGGFLGLAAAMSVAMLVRRWSVAWKPTTAMILALAAAIARSRLLSKLSQVDSARVEIDFVEISLAMSTVIWGTLALIWGTMALNDLIVANRPKRFLLAPMMAVSLALYSVSPLFGLLGMRVNLWTILCLFGLAGVAYGLGATYRWLFRAKNND